MISRGWFHSRGSLVLILQRAKWKRFLYSPHVYSVGHWGAFVNEEGCKGHDSELIFPWSLEQIFFHPLYWEDSSCWALRSAGWSCLGFPASASAAIIQALSVSAWRHLKWWEPSWDDILSTHIRLKTKTNWQKLSRSTLSLKKPSYCFSLCILFL